jgi:hypothetical protein
VPPADLGRASPLRRLAGRWFADDLDIPDERIHPLDHASHFVAEEASGDIVDQIGVFVAHDRERVPFLIFRIV